MAKRAPKPPAQGNAQNQKKRSAVMVTTDLGDEIEVTLKEVNPMYVQQVAATVTIPEVPTYTTQLYGGGTQEQPMDATMFFDTEGNQLEDIDVKEFARWTAYTNARDRAEQAQTNNLMRALFLRGTDCELPRTDWEEDDTFLGLHVPANPDHRRAYFLMTHVVAADAIKLMGEIMKLTGVDESIVAEAEKSFQDSVHQGEQE